MKHDASRGLTVQRDSKRCLQILADICAFRFRCYSGLIGGAFRLQERSERVQERRKTPQERSKRVQEALKRLSKRLSDAFSVEIPFWTPFWTPF